MISKFSKSIHYSRRLFGTSKKHHQDIINNYEKLTEPQRWSLIFQSALGAFRDPKRADLVSALGDLTSYPILLDIRDKMRKDPVGRRILEEQPRINTDAVHMNYLSELPVNTFGNRYAEFMSEHEFTPDERPLVKYIPDYELAYIMQRYKEIHDLLHVILCYDVDVDNELAVKWFEMIQLGLPSAVLSAFVGPLMLDSNTRKNLIIQQLPKVAENAYNCPFIMNVYFEKEWETDIDEFRSKLHISPMKYSQTH